MSRCQDQKYLKFRTLILTKKRQSQLWGLLGKVAIFMVTLLECEVLSDWAQKRMIYDLLWILTILENFKKKGKLFINFLAFVGGAQ